MGAALDAGGDGNSTASAERFSGAGRMSSGAGRSASKIRF
jgi:hypothetical protein